MSLSSALKASLGICVLILVIGLLQNRPWEAKAAPERTLTQYNGIIKGVKVKLEETAWRDQGMTTLRLEFIQENSANQRYRVIGYDINKDEKWDTILIERSTRTSIVTTIISSEDDKEEIHHIRPKWFGSAPPLPLPTEEEITSTRAKLSTILEAIKKDMIQKFSPGV